MTIVFNFSNTLEKFHFAFENMHYCVGMWLYEFGKVDLGLFTQNLSRGMDRIVSCS